MIILEQILQVQGIIGAVIGFCLSYFSSKTGDIRIIQNSTYISQPFEGIELLNREREFSVDFFHHSIKHHTANIDLLFVNTSSVNKVISNIQCSAHNKEGSELSSISLFIVENFEEGEEAEELYDQCSRMSSAFNMLSLKPGEAKRLNILVFIDTEFLEEGSGLKKLFLHFEDPTKRWVRKKRRQKIDFAQYLDVEESK